MIPAIPSSLFHIVDEQIRFWLAMNQLSRAKRSPGKAASFLAKSRHSNPLSRQGSCMPL
ncbi:hypothetical protein B4098_1801 [Heyndrickxia coagulans]|uniref:Uncharacterized protein n=1 Tax=Heyndrickxia coagulans TaxID=1398 RepID=A0A150KC90_HEYCO|nr:hypothetical protein B4098_1801 [Heyndrickxia coagulans]